MVKYRESDLDDIFTALADPVRRGVTEALVSGEKSVGELAEPFEMSMPAVMKHLAVLEKSGIVRSEKRGRVRYCILQPERLQVAESWLAQRARFWTERISALEQYLAPASEEKDQKI